MKNDKPTVLIVDDDPRTLKSLRRLLEVSGYCVETFSSSKACLNKTLPDGPCCAIVDAQMPRIAGLQLQSLLEKKHLGLPVIFISEEGDISKAVRAMRAGAADFLVKPLEGRKLLEVIKQALVQEHRFRREREERVTCGNRFNSLTSREKQVCAFVAQGKLNKQIAAELGICEKTVKVHRGRVMRKMAVESVAELVRVVVKLDLSAAQAVVKSRQRADSGTAANGPPFRAKEESSFNTRNFLG